MIPVVVVPPLSSFRRFGLLLSSRAIATRRTASASLSAAATAAANQGEHRIAKRRLQQRRRPFPIGAASALSFRRLYNSVSRDDLTAFRSILLEGDEVGGCGGRLITSNADDDGDDLIEPFYTDWTRQYSATAVSDDREKGRRVVLQPSTTKQVSRIVSHCYDRNIAIVPQGGNTGLVGGSVPLRMMPLGDHGGDGGGSEIVLSTSRLNRIHSLSDDDGILHCQAGCILQTLQEYSAERGYVVPIDLGAAGTCQIGGNVSTNAGGIFYYRYGSISSNLLGLTVVFPDSYGTILNLGSHNRKDNTGYKLHQLLVGSEGTIGIVTEVVMQCPPAPTSKQTALLVVTGSGSDDDNRRSYHENVMRVMDAAKKDLGEILACLEWMDCTIVRILNKNHDIPINITSSSSALPEEEEDSFALLLLETHGSNAEHDSEKLHSFLEKAMEDSCVRDGVVAQDNKQQNVFWLLRESCNPEMKLTGGHSYKYDLSLPSSQFVDFITEMNGYIMTDFPAGEIVSGHWGHILDGNLHYNLTTPSFNPDLVERIEPRIYESIMKRGGSISAEHGIGQAKRHALEMVHDVATLDTMRAVKKLFDPKGILNPGKFLP